MVRLAIIDHSTHQLYIEDVSENTLAKYDGDEQSYIDNNYKFEGEYSWDYIVDAGYLPDDDNGDFIDIDFSSIH